jgi:hypothetical protein
LSELEARLQALDVAFPSTPHIAAAVEVRLDAEQGPGRLPRRLGRRRLVLAVAVVVATFGAVLASSAGARSAFLEIFGIDGAVVTRVEELPPVTPSDSLAALGERVTLVEARRLAGFPLLRLPGDEDPDAIYFKRPGMVSFVYGRDFDVRLILSQIDGSLDEAFLKKVGPLGTVVERVRVDGEPGLLLTGEPHFFTYTSSTGTFEEEPFYLARDVLLWERDGRTFRLEGELERDRAIELAESLR